jgi:lipopolysaccharide export system protein LptA
MAKAGPAALAAAAMLHGGLAAGQDTKSRSPIDISADQAEVRNAECVAIWRGAAEAVQDKNRLRADTITIYSRPKGKGGDGQSTCGGTDRLEADGHVYYVTPEQNARGDHAVYVQSRDQIVITGDVVIAQGNNVARGARLTIKVSTHEAVMDGLASGPARPGRVRAVFYPEKTDQADGSAKP